MFIRSLSIVGLFIFVILFSCSSKNEVVIHDLKNEHVKMLNDTLLQVPIKISCFKNNRLIEVRKDHILIRKLKRFKNQIVCTNINFGEGIKTDEIYSSFTFGVFNRFKLFNTDSQITQLSNYSDIKLKYTISSEKIEMGKLKQDLYFGLPVEFNIDSETKNSYTRQFVYRIKLFKNSFDLKANLYFEKSIKKEIAGDIYKVKFLIGN
ncbi:hypothetical protein [Fluviicola taffensis]|uniref:hypothetical protein n=1 Tax=Fluviicola taffensis TaxID=191579 RepID=UPI003137F61C